MASCSRRTAEIRSHKAGRYPIKKPEMAPMIEKDHHQWHWILCALEFFLRGCGHRLFHPAPVYDGQCPLESPTLRRISPYPLPYRSIQYMVNGLSQLGKCHIEGPKTSIQVWLLCRSQPSPGTRDLSSIHAARQGNLSQYLEVCRSIWKNSATIHGMVILCKKLFAVPM